MDFRSRKEQIEKDFLPRLVKELNGAGCPVSRKARQLIKAELRAAAMVGAAEERYRSLQIIGERGTSAANEIIKQSVLTVLGYQD